MSDKRFRDPVYGYITIADKFVSSVVDQPEFQRLRRIVQTSYFPLYSSASHNRFSHSLGVYFLGSLLCEHLKEDIQLTPSIKTLLSPLEKEVDSDFETFRFACLLHDVGHAPFSHTCENYFYSSSGHGDMAKSSANAKLSDLVGSNSFRQDAQESLANPHEIISAIVGIKVFLKDRSKDDQEFFARCITGYKYSSDLDVRKQFRNCLISMLNSRFIDVDRLDYMMRDAHVSGYNSVNLDYRRLLASIVFYLDEQSHLSLGFSRSAISVLENLLFSRDFIKKHVQNNPSIVYNGAVLDYNVFQMNSHLKERNPNTPVFCIEALSKEGITIVADGNKFKLRLLSDDDVVFLLKNYVVTEPFLDFFDRSGHLKSAWKTETEFFAFARKYMACEKLLPNVIQMIDGLVRFLRSYSESQFWIDEDFLAVLESEREKYREMNEPTGPERKLQIWKCFCGKMFAKCPEERVFALFSRERFSSSFTNKVFKEIHLCFDGPSNERFVAAFDLLATPYGDRIDSQDGKTGVVERLYPLFFYPHSGLHSVVDAKSFFEVVNELIGEFEDFGEVFHSGY